MKMENGVYVDQETPGIRHSEVFDADIDWDLDRREILWETRLGSARATRLA